MTKSSGTWFHSKDEEISSQRRQQQEDHVGDSASGGSTEAGIVRGISRSIASAQRAAGRSLAKLPQVGRLPRRPPPAAATTAAKAAPRNVVPVRQVARFTDRISTGLDVWDAFDDSGGGGGATEKKKDNKQLLRRQRLQEQLTRIGTFATSLVKNSILGAIVFETYCWVVAAKATASRGQEEETTSPSSSFSSTIQIYQDVFETTPLAIHFLAGAAAGSLQGLGGMIWDSTAESIANRKLSSPTSTSTTTATTVLRTTGQHAAAHSILFGTYEGCKRLILNHLINHWDPDWNKVAAATTPGSTYNYFSTALTPPPKAASFLLPHQRIEYFVGIAMAGGLAGQFQHVVSHLLEQQQVRTMAAWRLLPTISSTLWAFPSSAIAFLAFEYGKDQVVEMSRDEEDDHE